MYITQIVAAVLYYIKKVLSEWNISPEISELTHINGTKVTDIYRAIVYIKAEGFSQKVLQCQVVLYNTVCLSLNRFSTQPW